MKTTIHDCEIIKLPVMVSEPMTVSPLYAGEHLGFNVERVYYIYDVPDDESRGEHAHKRLQQLLIAVRGSLHVLIDDGYDKKSVVLDRRRLRTVHPRPDLAPPVEFFVWRCLLGVGVLRLR